MRIRAVAGLTGCSRSFARGSLGWKLSTRLRWSSSSARQWSTPLAKNIAEAISVRTYDLPLNALTYAFARLLAQYRLRLTCANASLLLIVATTLHVLMARTNLARKETSSPRRRFPRYSESFWESGSWQSGWRKAKSVVGWRSWKLVLDEGHLWMICYGYGKETNSDV